VNGASREAPNMPSPPPGVLLHCGDPPKPAALPTSTRAAASLRADIVKTFGWVMVAAAAAVAIGLARGRKRALEFVTGYIVEYSLSVDNLFVFLLIFKYFKVPRDAQETVLFWGILGAMVLRGIMIVLGKALTDRFEWLTLGFAALLLYSAAKLLVEDEDDDHDPSHLDNNRVVRFSKRVLPVADHYCGDRFFVVSDGRILATPLMVVLISIELSDVVFAMDSVPAVLGISNDAFVIYASNVFAVMGLRSLYFVIADALTNLRFLSKALACILGFIGGKMIAAVVGFDLDVVVSLLVVLSFLVAGIALSVAFPAAAHLPTSDGMLSSDLEHVVSLECL
jgi:tellurite resistance protein TerC